VKKVNVKIKLHYLKYYESEYNNNYDMRLEQFIKTKFEYNISVGIFDILYERFVKHLIIE